jgi:hypothetical protein
MKKDVSSSAYNFRDKGAKQSLRSMELEPAANGGFVATHRFADDGGPGYKPPQTHVFAKDEGVKLLAHIAKHMGIPASAVEAEPDK